MERLAARLGPSSTTLECGRRGSAEVLADDFFMAGQCKRSAASAQSRTGVGRHPLRGLGKQESQPGGEEQARAEDVEGDGGGVIFARQPAGDVRAGESAKIAEGIDQTHSQSERTAGKN